MRFEDYKLSPEVEKGIQSLGFKRPTDIQFKSIPSILAGEDVLAVAQTGTGKTAAFAIPILHRLHIRKVDAYRQDGVKCLVMVPTHELAIQISDVFKKTGRFSRVRIMAMYGGVDQQKQVDELKNGVDILVATPGRMFDLMKQGFLELHRVETLVLDEADHMLDLGFIKDIRALVKRLPRRRQTLFFSATINPKIKKIAYSLIHQNAIRIQISPKNPVAKNVVHSVAFIEMDDKRFFLERIIQDNPDQKILAFVRTKVRAERVAKAMSRVQIEALTIHSGKAQQMRSKVMQQFRSGRVKVLIATDVSARGIDIPNVDIVVNYDLPEQAENYVHRVGRTGRGKQKGDAISFCSKEERETLGQIERFLGASIEVLDIDTTDYEDTIALSEGSENDWKSLMKDIESFDQVKKKKKGKKK